MTTRAERAAVDEIARAGMRTSMELCEQAGQEMRRAGTMRAAAPEIVDKMRQSDKDFTSNTPELSNGPTLHANRLRHTWPTALRSRCGLSRRGGDPWYSRLRNPDTRDGR
jgi:hypothetical protein